MERRNGVSRAWRWLCYGSWEVIITPVMLTLYLALISGGLRVTITELGMPLYKLPIPGFSRLGYEKGLSRLDLAHVMSVVMFLATWFLWKVNLAMVLAGGDFFHKSKLDPFILRRIVMGLSMLILGADALLFWKHISSNTGSLFAAKQATFSLQPVLVTACYVGILLFVVLVGVYLKYRAKED